MSAYSNNRFSNSSVWRNALESALIDDGGDDVVVPYNQVACAFPSPQPNPRSFDTPLIDHNELKAWAARQGWQVRAASEMSAENESSWPPVRFTKQA